MWQEVPQHLVSCVKRRYSDSPRGVILKIFSFILTFCQINLAVKEQGFTHYQLLFTHHLTKTKAPKPLLPLPNPLSPAQWLKNTESQNHAARDLQTTM